MGRFVQDFRFAFRTFLRGRSVSVLAVVAFAVGIGATTAVFSIFNAVLLKPLPYPDPDQLVAVYDTQPACATCPASFPKYHDWKSRNQVFAALGGSSPGPAVMTGKGDPERVAAMSVTASLADVFRISPAVGRWFSEAEDQAGGPKLVVLSDAFWKRRFNGSRAIVGQTIVLNGAAHEVIGVTPEGFTHRNADLFVPLQRKLDPATRGSHFLATYARLKPGVSLDRATTEMRALGQSLATEFGHNHGIDVRALHEVVVGNIRTPLRVLLGAVFLVLLIACANVANLLLAAGVARRRELAIRVALGAGRGHLVRQLTSEAIVLALAGGAIGILLASWAIRSFVVLAASQLPRATSIAIDGRVLAFTAVLSLGVGIACGLWPLLRLRSRELASSVREGDTRTGSGAGTSFGNGLVVAEIAVAFALLVGAGLLVKNLVLLMGRDAGVQTARIMAFDIGPSGPRYNDPAQVAAFHTSVLERLRGLGTVESAGAVSHLPMYRFGTNGDISIEGGNPWQADSAPLVEYRWVAGDYFKTLGIPLLAGRLFTPDDRQGSRQVVVISKAMAEKFWPGQDPIGRRLSGGSPYNGQNAWQVIGVVGDVRSFGLGVPAPYEMYRSMEQQSFASMTYVARSRNEEAGGLVQSARQIVSSIDPAVPVTTPQTMEEVVAGSVGQPRLMSALSSLFGILAGLLAMVGVYGVTAYNVRRQRREYGIRLALGAAPAEVQRMVLGRGTLVAVLGVALGIAGGVLLTRTLQGMLNDVKPLDLPVFAATALLVLLVVVLASYLPARSAGRVDPMVVLRDS
jgi:putative ABC transport system permease protein